jgi:hypothetical protein
MGPVNKVSHVFTLGHVAEMLGEKYSSGVGRLVRLQVSGEDLALRLALRSVDAGRGSGRGGASSSLVSR